MLNTAVTELNKDFDEIVEVLSLSLQAADDDESKQAMQVIEALRQNIQIMLRLESDVHNNKQPDITEEGISQIADYALNLLDEIAASCASRGLDEQTIRLHQLSIPVVVWLESHGGKLTKLDIVANAIASFANTIQQADKLEALCGLIATVVDATDQSIKFDLENVNPMRPWRILNLNWGIVATRTHNAELMEKVFDRLIENIPADAAQFFNEGMQQMDIVGYPDHVRLVMGKYAERTGSGSVLH